MEINSLRGEVLISEKGTSPLGLQNKNLFINFSRRKVNWAQTGEEEEESAVQGGGGGVAEGVAAAGGAGVRVLVSLPVALVTPPVVTKDKVSSFSPRESQAQFYCDSHELSSELEMHETELRAKFFMNVLMSTARAYKLTENQNSCGRC